MYIECIVVVKESDDEFSAKIPVLRSQNPRKEFKKMATIMSSCEPKDIASATRPIVFKFSQKMEQRLN